MTIFLRKEPTSCALTNAQPAPPTAAQRDVVMYRDRDATRPCGRFNWAYSDKPTKRNKRVKFNCFTVPVVWLDDLQTTH